jgi:hypothetical protein
LPLCPGWPGPQSFYLHLAWSTTPTFY